VRPSQVGIALRVKSERAYAEQTGRKTPGEQCKRPVGGFLFP
jgi:hypothetical protein